jgi:hypothetical protein
MIDGISAGIRRDQNRDHSSHCRTAARKHALRGDCRKDFCVVAKAALLPELVDSEDVINARCVLTQKLAQHVTTCALFNIFAIFLTIQYTLRMFL